MGATFFLGEGMKKYTKDEALKIIIAAAKEYDKKLNDKHFMIVYQVGKTVKMAEVGFRDMNFLHLTGINTKLSAPMFYSACISGKLSVNDISLDNQGKAQQKLMVLPYLSKDQSIEKLPDIVKQKISIGESK